MVPTHIVLTINNLFYQFQEKCRGQKCHVCIINLGVLFIDKVNIF